MIDMDYEQKYNEALERARKLKEMYPQDAPGYEEVFPELAESEDERIREEIVDYFKKECECLLNDFRDKEDEKQLSFYKKALAWLEKQKEPENVSATTMAPSCWAEEPSLQKEQKPVEPTGKLSREEYLYQLLIDQLITYSDYEYLTGKKPAEWSEEDEAMIECLIRHTQEEFDELCNDRYGHQEIISDLKESCRERINWLENRLKPLRPHWKPSDVCYGVKGDPDPAGVWKPSEEQMGALAYAIQVLAPRAAKASKELENLREQLKKL